MVLSPLRNAFPLAAPPFHFPSISHGTCMPLAVSEMFIYNLSIICHIGFI